MKVITNTDIIENRSKWAKRVSPVAMFVLLAGFFVNLYAIFNGLDRPEFTQYTLILLTIGFILALISSSLVNRWVREPRADQVLSTTLKKFSKDYVLFNYTILPPHILLTPSRLYVIVVKRHSGQITVKGHRFSRKFSLGRLFRFFADEGLGLPVSEAENGVSKLKKLLSKHLTGEELPELKSLIIFVDKNVELSIQDLIVPVMRSNELKAHLREHDKRRVISGTLRNTLVEIIGSAYQEERK